MNLKAVLIISLLCSFCCPAFAQKNRVEVSLSGYKMYYVVHENYIFSTAGISFGRKLNNKMRINIKYIFPNHGYRPLSSSRVPDERTLYVVPEKLDNYDDTGKLFNRQWFHYFDAGVQYELLSFRNQSLSVKQNISMAYGKGFYLTRVSALAVPGNSFHVIDTEFEKRKEVFLGGVTGLAYDYHVWNNRINIGLDVAARYYTNSFPFQINYGLHLGYNF